LATIGSVNENLMLFFDGMGKMLILLCPVKE